MSISNDKERFTIIIDKEVKKEIKKLADENNRKMSNYAALVLKEHVKQHLQNKNPSDK